MSPQDSWDWPLLLYVTTTILQLPERSFWRMTPRKLNALVKVHIEVNTSPEDKKKQKKQNWEPEMFIDQL